MIQISVVIRSQCGNTFERIRKLKLKILRDPFTLIKDYVSKDTQYQTNCSQKPYKLRLSVPYFYLNIQYNE